MRGEMIADHLRETTNLMNEWWSRLRDWSAWLALTSAPSWFERMAPTRSP
jgi:hypothetical protein